MYYVDRFRFEYWDGPAPVVPSQRILVTHRPGVNGVSHQKLGRWGESFTVTLTSHWESQATAFSNFQFMKDSLIGTGGVALVYNDVDWSLWSGTLYHVTAIELVQIRSHLYLAGPGYSHANGAALTARFTFSPEVT